MIQMEYIVDRDKSLLTIMFDQEVLKHLQAKCDDNLYFFQSNHNAKFLTLLKADTGYRIKRVPHRRKTYQINVGHKLSYIDEFNLKDCTYFKKRKLIRIKL